nr:GNAT family N-acetyltransferase [Jannaschia sp. S6380]
MAALQAAAFDGATRWSAASIRAALAAPGGFAVVRADAFLLGRVVADEAELLTLVVGAGARRRGVGRTLMAGFDDVARRRGARQAFLEVAADNAAALALYRGAGWTGAGRRAAYYGDVDALILRKSF